jgi:hypothetical protein
MGFQVLTATIMKSVFWDMVMVLILEAGHTAEMPVRIYETTRQYIPEVSQLH